MEQKKNVDARVDTSAPQYTKILKGLRKNLIASTALKI